MEDMVHDAVTLSSCKELSPEADETASRHNEFHADITSSFHHIHQVALSNAKGFHNSTHKFLWYVNGQVFQWFTQLAINFFEDYARFTNL